MSNEFSFKKMGRLQRACVLICVVYLVGAALFYFAAAMDWDIQASEEKLMNEDIRMGLPTGDVVVEQGFIPQAQTIERVEPYFEIIGNVTEKSVVVELLQDTKVLASKTMLLSEVVKTGFQTVLFDEPAQVNKGKEATIRISIKGLEEINAVMLYYGNSVSTLKGPVAVREESALTLNGETVNGKLAVKVIGRNVYHYSKIYIMIASIAFVCLLILMITQVRKFRRNESTFIIRIMMVFDRYSYLMRQMVSRDFQVKYKRSVLGVVWSFLNPLLTMAVQYFVFSNLFGFSTDNYMVYLLTGIVTFNYFSEAAGTGLNSIVGNASLITKVYVPKFIYPVIPVFSATINMLFSMIPLLGVMLLNGVVFTKALLLLPIGILFVMVFSIGMSMILSTAMVFFRDTKFLWGVISMLWNFLTPIFYTESIIPARFLGLYHLNPLYQFVYFMRTVIIGGVSPNPITYLYCTVAALVPLLIGLILFKKKQDQFVFNL